MVEGSGFENRRTREGSRGSNPLSSSRTCGGCGEALEGADHPQTGGGETWTWRCDCGWAAARTVAGASADTGAHRAIARALERMSDPPVASTPDGVYGPGDYGGNGP